MVLQALADTIEDVVLRQAVGLKLRLGTDAGEHQYLRRIVGPARQNDLAPGGDGNRRAVAPASAIGDAGRAPAVEFDIRDVGVGADLEVRALHGGLEERAGGRHAAALQNRALGVVDAFLLAGVVVRVGRNAHFVGTLDEEVGQGMAPVRIGNGEGAGGTTVRVVRVAVGDAALETLEVGQDVDIAPAAVAELGPVVEVLALAAVDDMAVDRTRAAERLAARGIDPPAGGVGPGFLLIAPVNGGVVERLHETGRDVDHRVGVGGASLEDADGDARIRA